MAPASESAQANEGGDDEGDEDDELLALLDPDYVHHHLSERGATLKSLGDAWESVARKLCGR